MAIESEDDLCRHVIAGMVIPVMHAFKEGDPSARDIVTRAMDHLARQHRSACQIARDRGNLNSISPLVLYGGVFIYNPELREIVAERVRRKMRSQVDVVTPETAGAMRPVMGSLLYALGHSRSNGLLLPPEAVAAKLFEQSKAREALKND